MIEPLKAEDLYRATPVEAFEFETTASLQASPEVIGQQRAQILG